MSDKKIMDSKEILDEIDSFEDHVERLYLSNRLSYDESYHKEVIKIYRKLMSKIRNSHLSEEDKAFMIEVITELFNEHKNS